MTNGASITDIRIARALACLDALAAQHPELTHPTRQRRLAERLEADSMARPYTGKAEQVMVRMTSDMITELDDILTPAIARAVPGLTPTRSDAIRWAIGKAIEEAKRAKAQGL